MISLQKPVRVFITGPLMSKILKNVQEIDTYTFKAILGRIETIETKTKLKDGDSDPGQMKKEHVEFSAHLIVPIPISVWNRRENLWEHNKFREWQTDVIKALNLGKDFKVIGFIRFREMDREKMKVTTFLFCFSVS